MSTTVLQDYDRHGLVWALDPASGLLVPASGRCQGFVHVLPHGTGTFAALYADDAALWLQFGERRWDGEEVTVRHVQRPDGTRVVTVDHPSGPRWQTQLPPPDTGPYDPAYDWTDTLADNFFLWADEQLSDPHRRAVLRDHYRRGFAPL
ncbi:hypothetical protein ABTZ57_39640 [Streptomyces sp. NPDC094048]|uniref:hypothetical protein n=1 Tax=Streptomyces sp. NPDC094048 TaxID=3155207 RepID=UPI00331BD4C9